MICHDQIFIEIKFIERYWTILKTYVVYTNLLYTYTILLMNNNIKTIRNKDNSGSVSEKYYSIIGQNKLFKNNLKSTFSSTRLLVYIAIHSH